MTPTTTGLRQHVIGQLSQWSGYSVFCKAVDRFPTLDIYLAGGVLRNFLSRTDIKSKDFDFFVNGPNFSEFLKFLDEHGELNFGPFGSPRWRLHKTDQTYCDIIYIPQFNNGLWMCEDIFDTLNQFDFTANAVALDMRSHEVFDPQNGIRDAERRVLRAVRFDYPEEPIASNLPLTRNCVLWMRLNGFARTLGFKIEPVTAGWFEANRHYSLQQTLYDSVFKG